MPRLFVALEPSPEFRDALAALQDRLRAAGVAGRWPDPACLHMTLAYIGMWPEDVTALLPPVRRPFPLTLSRLGIFPGADVLWAGVEPSAELDWLAAEVRRILDGAGIPFDRQPFFPHITLARKPRLPEGFGLPEFPVPAAVLTVREVCLYQSEPGMRYTVIGRGMKL